jgi:hypothetical protein
MAYRFSTSLVLAFISLLLCGCAAEVVRQPAALQPPPAESRATIEITRLTTIVLPTGYERSLLTGSRWQRVGSIPQGQVFRPLDTVFTIEGANTHEAFLVIQDARLVGFYLPGERAYAPLETGLALQFKASQ